VSFTRAHAFLKEQCWDLKDTYGLLLDADMIFSPGTLLQQNLTEPGYTVVQVAGTLEYPNTRLVRMDYPWKCVGVTHEYWSGPTQQMARSVCFIDDRNDGGCKSDKFERDVRLLERGLQEDPTNGRYMFYLAQSYHCLRRWDDARKMYKKRIVTGGWDEEIWYSHYMVGKCWLELNNIPKFEYWMQKAIALRPTRAEAYYQLVKHFREHSRHFKAYQYLVDGKRVPMSKDSLFLEMDVYKYLFDYERTILDFYVNPDRKSGLRTCIDYLLKTDHNRHNVIFNFQFYVQPVVSTHTELGSRLPAPFPGYTPSAISVCDYPMANVRYINYWMENGDYKTPPGQPVLTENAYVNLETMEVVAKMDDSSVGMPKYPHPVMGLEDLRLYKNTEGLSFVATTQEHAEGKVRLLQGRYGPDGTYSDCKVLESPHNRQCEKNWLPIQGTDMMIYGWSPFEVLDRKGIRRSIPTPPMFSAFCGSAPPILVGDKFWTLVHMVEYAKPRKYYHLFVETQSIDKVTRITLPFVFKSAAVEYCVSCRLSDPTTVSCYVSFADANPARIDIPFSSLEWVSLP
jgi:tetratricopeptide (TPR) repeat protein